MNLIQLIYVSDLVPGQEAEIPDILASAVRHNQEDALTGMLLYSGGNFLQVLEGPAPVVHATFDRIGRDPRHRNILVLTEEPVAQRHFATWSMGFRQLGPEQVRQLPRLAPYFQYGFDRSAIRAKPGVALEMLELFSQGNL